MQWSDNAIILKVKNHGESSVILEVFCRDNGRALGLVKGGKSRRIRSILQVGNNISVTWKARLEEHLGQFSVESEKSRAAILYSEPLNLSAVMHICSLLRLIAERNPYNDLWHETDELLDSIYNENEHKKWFYKIAKWELFFLSEYGYGLDFNSCIACGAEEELIYVSPKSASAVCAKDGEPYSDKLLKLPELFLDTQISYDELSLEDLKDSFYLTGYFINKYIFSSYKNDNIAYNRDYCISQISSKLTGNEL